MMISVISAVFCLILIYVWNKRKEYLLSLKLQGPIAYPLIGNALEFLGDQEDLFEKTVTLIQKYASPVRMWFGPKFTIIFHEVSQVEKILTSWKFAHKDDTYDFLKPFDGESLVSGSGPKWKKDRRKIGPFLSIKSVENYSDIILDNARILNGILEREVGNKSFDIRVYLHRCCNDIVIESLFAEEVHAQQGQIDDFMHQVSRAYVLIYLRITKVWLRSDFIFNMTKFGQEHNKILKKIHGKLQDLISGAKAKRMTTRKTTIFNSLLDLINEDPEFANDEELLHHVTTLYSAAEDTLTSISSFMILLCGMYQNYQEKIAEEIKTIIGTDPKNINIRNVQELEFFDMCLKETLRHFPIAPFTMRKTTEEVRVDDLLVPKGCSVMVSIINVHRDEKNWEKPEDFYPEHFLPEVVAIRHPFAYLPFSAGPRSCVGKSFAMVSLKLLLVTILQKYQFFADGRIQDLKLCADLSVRLVGGHNVRIKKRE